MNAGVVKSLVGVRVIVDSQEGDTFNVDKGLDTPLRIGRESSCDIVLPSTMVSRHHATLEKKGNTLLFTDCSANGSLVDGGILKKDSVPLNPAMSIQIGPFRLRVMLRAQSQGTPKPVGKTRKKNKLLQDQFTSKNEITEENKSIPPKSGTFDVPASLRREIHRHLVDNLDLAKLERSRMNPHMLRAKVKVGLESIIDNVKGRLPQNVDIDALLKELADEALGLGPLEDLIADPRVSEIMVVDPNTIYIERDGKIQLSPYRFTDDQSVRSCIERIVTPLGRRIDESSPMLDARLPDGSRVNAVIRPLAIKGTCITIRKFSKTPLTMANLVEFKTLNKRMALFLERAVKARKNILISGGTGSGKTTLLNILSASIPESERIVTIEDSAELSLAQTHVVSLECRPANMEGKGEITIRDLVKNAMRMRPDRVIVGEVRGGEALDMLQAMNTCLLYTSPSPRDATLSRMPSSA